MSISDLVANSGGTPTAFVKDSPIGTAFQGTIVAADVRQVTDYDSGKPKFWDDGSPQQQVAVIIQTNLRDPGLADDDGKRGIYIKWWGDSRKEALRAIKAAGDTDIRVGGQWYARYVSDKPNDNPRLNASKIYQYAYQMPAQTAGLDLAGQLPAAAADPFAAQQQAPAPQQQQQAYQPPAAADPFNAPQQALAQQQQAYQQQQQQAYQQQQQQAYQPPAAQVDHFAQLGAQPIPAAQPAAAAPPVTAAALAGGAQLPAAQPAAAAEPQVNVEQIKTFLGLAMTNEQIAGATGASLDVIEAIRNLP